VVGGVHGYRARPYDCSGARQGSLGALSGAHSGAALYEGTVSHFAPLKVNDTLTLDFDSDTDFESHHYAFKVDESEFDGIFACIKAEDIVWQRVGFA
jgi:hypothetical protein